MNFKIFVSDVLFLALFVAIPCEQALVKRVLPVHKDCDPNIRPLTCRKGDWVRTDIADCAYQRHGLHFTCSPEKPFTLSSFSWIVDVDERNKCEPMNGLRFVCGAAGTDTRCVCSDTNLFYNIGWNKCKCQYWPAQDIGADSPAFCTGYYAGGQSGVHHWACCNNCNDSTPNSCQTQTWQGGSSIDYCGTCGRKTGEGQEKYYFNCGSCETQNRCKTMCGGWRSWPLFCWNWLDCFKDCCLKSS